MLERIAILSATATIAILALGCTAETLESEEDTQESEQAFFPWGHENITGAAVANTNRRFLNSKGIRQNFSPFNAAAAKEGAVDTDCTDTSTCKILTGMAKSLGESNPGNVRAWHSMRRPNETNRTACNNTREAIITAAIKAIDYYKDNYWFSYFAGHGSHMIQDSFVDSHVTRSGKSLTVLKPWTNHETTAQKLAHAAGDGTWSSSPGPATEGYLSAVGWMKYDAQGGNKPSATQIRARVVEVLDGTNRGLDKNYQGYFKCP